MCGCDGVDVNLAAVWVYVNGVAGKLCLVNRADSLFGGCVGL